MLQISFILIVSELRWGKDRHANRGFFYFGFIVSWHLHIATPSGYMRSNEDLIPPLRTISIIVEVFERVRCKVRRSP